MGSLELGMQRGSGRSASAVRNHLPLILDETKRVKNPKEISQTLYDFTSGRARGRGSVKGISVSPTWTSVLLASGEAPINSFSEDGGTRAGTLEMWGVTVWPN